MGRRGPAPMPSALKIATGNAGKRPIRDDEPKPEVGAPKCPTWLASDAKSIWRQLAPRLVRAGVLTKLDGNALGRYCDVLCRWLAARDDEDEKLYQKLGVMLLRLEQEFGMTPSARTRLRVEPRADEGDALDKLIRKSRSEHRR